VTPFATCSASTPLPPAAGSRHVRAPDAERATMLWATSLYWHFVDIVWVILFCLVYLL